MCSDCRNFTLAPWGQKRRRCSYCGNLINIRKASCAIFDGHEAASNAVREFNAVRGGDEFKKAVEKSRERLHALMPSERIEIKEISEQDETTRRYGKRKRLMILLQKEASKPCSLGRLEEQCEKYKLEWVWVEKQLLKLSNSGHVIFPRPWQVRLVGQLEEENDSKKSVIDISSEIVAILEEKGSMEVIDLRKHFETKGISQESIDSSLDKLMKKGELFEPSQGIVKLV
jgi:hypothetical protein